MKRLRITHRTEYHYHEPVSFGQHRVMMRPREGHDVRIIRGRLDVAPHATVSWKRDVYGNSIAILSFAEPARKLAIHGEAEIQYMRDTPVDYLIDPGAREYPFQFAPEEQMELVAFRLPSYPYDGTKLRDWLLELYRPGQTVGTIGLLERLNSHIHASLTYRHREEASVQTPCQTLALGSGSCRDYAVLMMEAARHWGFGARFVSGYIQMAEGQHGATHAWTEIYIPGAGWFGFDPTNDKVAGGEHIAVAVAREQEKASPVSGSWSGPADAFERMEVSVQVVAMDGQAH